MLLCELDELEEFDGTNGITYYIDCPSEEHMKSVFNHLKNRSWRWDPKYFKLNNVYDLFEFSPYSNRNSEFFTHIYITLYIYNSHKLISYSFFKTEKIKSFQEIIIEWDEDEEEEYELESDELEDLGDEEDELKCPSEEQMKSMFRRKPFLTAAQLKKLPRGTKITWHPEILKNFKKENICYNCGPFVIEKIEYINNQGEWPSYLCRSYVSGSCIIHLDKVIYDVVDYICILKNGMNAESNINEPVFMLYEGDEVKKKGEHISLREQSKLLKEKGKGNEVRVEENSKTIKVGNIVLKKQNKVNVKEDEKTIKVGNVVLNKQNSVKVVKEKVVKQDGQVWFAKKKRKKTMSEEIKNSLVKGAKVGASKKAAKVLTTTVKKMLGDNYPEFLKTPMGQMLEPFIVPAAVVFLLERFAGDGDGGFEDERLAKIYEVANLALEGEAAEKVEELLGMLNPQIDALVAKL